MATYGVFGLGKSGKATVDYLLGRGDEVFAWDDKPESRSNITCTEPANWQWSKIEALVLSPGIPLTHPKPHYIVEAAQKYGKKIICDIEILWQDNSSAKFIGITGTNGKSTTTALIAHILQTNNFDYAVGGNLGTPALTLGKHKYYVLEMSSYQLDLIDKTRLDIAIWLNISPDHIDRHGDLEGYIKAKKNIFRNGNSFRIVGIDDEYSKKIAEEFAAIKITRKNKIADFARLPGEHNSQNINCAFQVAKALGITDDKIIEAIHTFPGLAHRMEFVAESGGVKYINDSKATNADSTEWALKAFDNIYWIAGGVPKSGGIKALADFFPKIKKAYLIGEASEEFAATLHGKVIYEFCDNMEKAVKSASKDAENGVILLSPACASFDQYKNFEERGEHFKKIALNIINETKSL